MSPPSVSTKKSATREDVAIGARRRTRSMAHSSRASRTEEAEKKMLMATRKRKKNASTSSFVRSRKKDKEVRRQEEGAQVTTTTKGRPSLGDLGCLPLEISRIILGFLKGSGKDYANIMRVCKTLNQMISKDVSYIWAIAARVAGPVRTLEIATVETITSAFDFVEESSPSVRRVDLDTGDVYIGAVISDRGKLVPHGQGICHYDGKTYCGEWCLGDREGMGYLRTNGGSYYDGTYFGKFRKGKRHGWGVYRYKDDKENYVKYEGGYKNDRRSGIGIELQMKDAKISLFQNDAFDHPQIQNVRVGQYHGTPYGVHQIWKNDKKQVVVETMDFGKKRDLRRRRDV